jgi:outer membrane protein OmpA-like peptidoglycan-associated protein
MVVANTKKVGSSGNAIRDKVGSFRIKKRPIPIRFETGKPTLTKDGKNSAKQLAIYLTNKNSSHVTLVGHTDARGSDNYNCRLSVGRATSLKNYLVDYLEVDFAVDAMGKGEREPYIPYKANRYTKKEIDKLNRRVEFFTNPSDVSRDKECG